MYLIYVEIGLIIFWSSSYIINNLISAFLGKTPGTQRYRGLSKGDSAQQQLSLQQQQPLLLQQLLLLPQLLLQPQPLLLPQQLLQQQLLPLLLPQQQKRMRIRTMIQQQPEPLLLFHIIKDLLVRCEAFACLNLIICRR